MNEELQRITIARACGWKDVEKRIICEGTGMDCYVWSSGIIGLGGREIPDYLRDLNAMHEAEKVLTEEQWTDYYDNLLDTTKPSFVLRDITHATAAQRAEAFLRVMGLWLDSSNGGEG